MRDPLPVALLLAGHFNPIEEGFSKVEKGLLQEGPGQDRRGPLVEAMGEALLAVITVRDVRGFFEHTGYRATGQTF